MEVPSPLRGEGQGEGGILIALIKPQFEVGKKFVGKGGIVKDREKQEECVKKISAFCRERGFEILGTLPSPILGQDGNQEFLLAAFKLHPPLPPCRRLHLHRRSRH